MQTATNSYTIFAVLTSVLLNFRMFWDVRLDCMTLKKKKKEEEEEEEEAEDEEEILILRNVGNYLHKDKTLRHRRRESPNIIKPNVMFVFRAMERVITPSVKHT